MNPEFNPLLDFNPLTDARLNIVLLEPEIPQNTGTIGRLCLGTGTRLHLVKPLGFDLDEKAVRRAGLDYWQHVVPLLQIHDSTEDFFASLPTTARVILIETGSSKMYWDCPFQPGDFIVFGRETTGIPTTVRNRFRDRLYSIPMWDSRIRSLNLSNAVSLVTYEAMRQIANI